ncbi:MAG: ABC transporter ATP-binding protein, partial [Anaerolineales bacterium]|nr:ABC transporter ATP-binding protein [Anaerolineales bacterium]
MFDNSRLLGVEVESASSISGTLKRLGGYFRPYRWVLVGVMALIILGTLMQTVIPSLQGQAVDCYLGPFAQSMVEGNRAASTDTTAFDNCWYTTPDPSATAAETLRGFGFLILIILALYIGGAAVGGLQFYLMARAGLQVLRDLRVEIFQHIHRLSLSYFTKNEAGDVMSRVTNDIDTLQQVISFGLIQVVQGILLMIFIVVAMLIMSIPLAVMTLITVPLMFLATRFFSTQARRAFRQARQEIGAVNSDLQESISAVREVQAFSREDENIEQFRLSNAANRDANIKAQAYSSALAPTLEALSYVSLALVAAVGGILILREQTLLGTAVSVGLIVTFIAFSQQFNRPVQQ